jgi:hypothetical protein
MEAMLGIFCIAIFISTSKNITSFLLLFMFTIQQNWRMEVTGVGERGGRWR